MNTKKDLQNFLTQYIHNNGLEKAKLDIDRIIKSYDNKKIGRPIGSNKYKPYVLSVIIQQVCGPATKESGYLLQYPEDWLQKCVNIFKETRKYQPAERIFRSEKLQKVNFDLAITSVKALEKAFQREKIRLDREMKMMASLRPILERQLQEDKKS